MHASLLETTSHDCRAFWATSSSTTYVPPAVRVPEHQWVPLVRSSYSRNFIKPPNDRPTTAAFQSRAQATYTAPPLGRPEPAPGVPGPSRSGYSLNVRLHFSHHEKMPVIPSMAATSFTQPPRPPPETDMTVNSVLHDGYTTNGRILPDHPVHRQPSQVRDSSYEAANKVLVNHEQHMHVASAPAALPHFKTGYSRIEYHRPGPARMGTDGVPVVGFGPVADTPPLQTAIAAVAQSASHNSFLPPSAYQPVVQVLSPVAQSVYMNPPMSPLSFSPSPSQPHTLVSPHKLGKSKSQATAFDFAAAAASTATAVRVPPEQHLLQQHPIPIQPALFQAPTAAAPPPLPFPATHSAAAAASVPPHQQAERHQQTVPLPPHHPVATSMASAASQPSVSAPASVSTVAAALAAAATAATATNAPPTAIVTASSSLSASVSAASLLSPSAALRVSVVSAPHSTLPPSLEHHLVHRHRNATAAAPPPDEPKFERSGFAHNHRRDVWQPMDAKPVERSHVPPTAHILSPVAAVVSPAKTEKRAVQRRTEEQASSSTHSATTTTTTITTTTTATAAATTTTTTTSEAPMLTDSPHEHTTTSSHLPLHHHNHHHSQARLLPPPPPAALVVEPERHAPRRALVPPRDPHMPSLPPAEQFSSAAAVAYAPVSYHVDRTEIARAVTAYSPHTLAAVRRERVVVEAKALSASASKAPTGYDMVARSADPITAHAIGFDPSIVAGSRARLLAKQRPAELEDRHAHKSAGGKRHAQQASVAAAHTAATATAAADAKRHALSDGTSAPVDQAALQAQLQKQQQQQQELQQLLKEKLVMLQRQQLKSQSKSIF